MSKGTRVRYSVSTGRYFKLYFNILGERSSFVVQERVELVSLANESRASIDEWIKKPGQMMVLPGHTLRYFEYRQDTGERLSKPSYQGLTRRELMQIGR